MVCAVPTPAVLGPLEQRPSSVEHALRTPPGVYNKVVPTRAEERAQGRVRLILKGEDDGGFDREFWQAMPPAKRLECVWEMVEELQAWRGDGGEPRLQRSVLFVERRRR